MSKQVKVAETSPSPAAGKAPKVTKAKIASHPLPRIGVHVSVAGGLENAFVNALAAGCDCMQIFVKNQRQWRAKPLSEDQIRLFRAGREQSSISPITAHASYLLNLAAPNDAIRNMSIDAMIDELTRCEVLGIESLIFHPGAHLRGEDRTSYSEVPTQIRKPKRSRDRKEADSKTGTVDLFTEQSGPLAMNNTTLDSHMLSGIGRIAQSLDIVHTRCAGFQTKLLLECTAGQGSAIGWQFEQLAEILKRVRDADRLGVCLDTCHLFAAGYDFRTPETYAAMIDKLDSAIGVAQVRCIHTNDSKRELGSRVDRHEHIGKGLIGKSGFANFVNDPRFCEVPFILETPKEKDEKGRDWDVVNVRVLRRLVR